MITAYIDESGDLGRGGNFFVLAAVVFRSEQDEKRVNRIIRREQKLNGIGEPCKSVAEIKSCHLCFTQRQRILNKITKQDGTLFYYLVIYKRAVKLLRQKALNKNLVYNYFSKLLTDMIFSDFYDHFRIIFDQRTTCVKSMNSLPDYITIGAYINHGCLDKRIEVLQRDSRTLNNLQTADVLAGTVFHAYRDHKQHFLELIKSHVARFDEFPKYEFKGGFLPHPS